MCTRGRFSVMIKSPDKLINKGDYTPLKNSSDLYNTFWGKWSCYWTYAEQPSSEAEKGIDIFICTNEI